MVQSYKVFISDKTIYLLSGEKKFFPKKNDTIHLFKENEKLHELFVKFNNSKKSKRLIIYSSEINTLKKSFFSMFHYVEAAGGIVSDNNNNILFIRRFNKWDFPKGKCELLETKKETALREIEEETGITKITIEGKLPPSYHIYYRFDKLVLKKTSWYRCSTINQNTIPQIEESITETKWVDKNLAKQYTNSSYKSIKNLYLDFEKAMQKQEITKQ